MTFDPNRHLIKVQGGRSYLPVSARLIWFRSEHPDWGIETEPLTIDNEKNFAIFRAKIYNADGKLMATGTKKEDLKGFPDWCEKAETGAVGRALALCGYGTQFAPELDEVHMGRFADSPQGGSSFDRFNGSSSGRFERTPTPAPRFDRAPDNNRAPESGRPPQRNGARPALEQPQRPARPALEDDDSPFDEVPSASVKSPKDAPEAKASAGDAPAGPPACQNCSKTLTKSQHELSLRNYGAALCPACQKDSKGREVKEASPDYEVAAGA